MERAVRDKKPFFIWHNSTRMHVWTRLSPKYQDKTGYGLYPDGMQELDDVVGALLKKIDDLGIADRTIVIFSTDNGAGDSDLVWELQPALRYQFTDRIAGRFGYRRLQYEFEDGRADVDVGFQGFLLGLTVAL